MTGLSHDLELRLASEVSMVLEGDVLVIRGAGAPLRLHASFLVLVDAFRKTTTLGAVLSGLPARTTQEWMERSAVVAEMLRRGVLVSEETTRIEARSYGYDAAHNHIAMLADVPRTKSYVEAVRSVVSPGDVVVDVGTGSGVLSIAAAQAGARRVFAIERSGIADVARRLFLENGFADRIEIVRGTSTEIDLPERADVMVSELIGNDPFDEQILAYTRDARRRLLVDDPKVLPSRLRVFVTAVEATPQVLAEYRFSSAALGRWSTDYGIDFQALEELVPDVPLQAMLSRGTASKTSPCSEPALVCDVDLADPPARIAATTKVEVAAQRRAVDGFLLTFELELAPGYVISTNPWRKDGAQHWGIPLWLLPSSASVEGGGRFGVHYEFTGVKSTLKVERNSWTP